MTRWYKEHIQDRPNDVEKLLRDATDQFLSLMAYVQKELDYLYNLYDVRERQSGQRNAQVEPEVRVMRNADASTDGQSSE